MNSSKHQTKNTIVNKYKLIYLPLVIVLILVFSISGITYYISKDFLLKQMKQDGLEHVNQIAQQIENNNQSLETINQMLDNKIILAGNNSLRAQDQLTNDLLISSTKELDVGEINWYDSNGKIVYSNIVKYIGWVAPPDHPVITFSKNTMPTFVEKEVRQVTDYDDVFKYGYVRGKNGYFVQIGISANVVSALTEKFSYQHIVEELTQENNITYALITDPQMKVINRSQKEDIRRDSMDNEILKEALTGKQIVNEWYYEKKAIRVFDIAQPIYRNGEIIGAVNIGISMEKVYSAIYIISIMSSLLAIIMSSFFLWVQNKNIINPIHRLNQCIGTIDIENNIEYRLPIVDNDPFRGLAISINNILNKTQEYLNQVIEKQLKLHSSNEELTSAYQQLATAEEELRSQYDEIQTYANKLEYNSNHDHLTNLPNRRKLMSKLEYAMNENKSGAVILLDIDNFKGINDTLGHVYGDKLLKRVADELTKINDGELFIARFGGDEFFILIQEKKDPAVIENYAKKIINIFKNKLIIEGEEIYISCSMGITLYPLDSQQVTQLLMNADMAMYKVKNSGKNNYMFFNEEMTITLKEQHNIQQLLREALQEQKFKLVYQPQICTFTGQVVGFEALLRLKDLPLSPSLFIPISEETGMIIEIGRWVTKETIKQLARWKKQGLVSKPIAINFSAKQLYDIHYIDFLKKELQEAKVEPEFLSIEITESVFFDKKDEIIVFLHRLKALGIKIALDDFGTGYSSLSYLTFLPVDKIKLDKSLSDKFLELENIKVMDSLISLAHSLNLEVIAEGIEEIQQYKRLKAGGCNYIQGYLFSKPLEAIEIEKIYNDNFLNKILK